MATPYTKPYLKNRKNINDKPLLNTGNSKFINIYYLI